MLYRMNNPKISIIIPTKDRGDVFNRSINAAILASIDSNAEIIVINDSKTNVPSIPNNSNIVTLLNNPKSGVASARNLGASVARSNYLLFIDDDIVIDKVSLQFAIDFLEKNENSCINVNWKYPVDLYNKCLTTAFGRFMLKNELNNLRGWRKNEKWLDNEMFEVNCGASYFLGMSKLDFVLVGGYNEKFPYAGCEDYEFNARIVKNKIKIFIEPRVMVFHNEADKLELLVWLKRNYNGGVTLKIGYELGYNEVKPETTNIKKVIYKIISPFEKMIYLLVKSIPNFTFFDLIAHKGINVLLGINIFNGYNKK